MKLVRCLVWILLGLSLVGCQGGLLLAPTPTVPYGASPTAPTLATTPLTTKEPEATAISSDQPLVVWVPPNFDPTSGTNAGNLFKSRLESFSSQNPGISIRVRVKAETGPGSLLDALSAASAAAPSDLPDLLALSSDDIQIAALKGLLYPFEDASSSIDDPDWYSYARQMAGLQGSTFGLPFAGDALALLYRPAQVNKVPLDWESLINQSVPLVFAVGDNQALFTLLQYQAAGGNIRDAQNRPTLDAANLSQVLSFYKNALDSGIIPSWSVSFDTGSAWKTYQDQKANMVISWVTRYLNERPPDTTVSVIPVPGQKTLTYATGWLWAIPSARPERRTLATRLAEYLVNSQFLSQWSVAAGYLPTRPSALAAWADQSLQALVSPIVLSAQARPSADLLVILGPILRDAALSVFNGQADPIQAANQAASRLKAP